MYGASNIRSVNDIFQSKFVLSSIFVLRSVFSICYVVYLVLNLVCRFRGPNSFFEVILSFLLAGRTLCT